jgi:aminopeptidase
MPRSEFEQNLEKYAEVIVKIGLNIQPDQRLLLPVAPLEARGLVQSITMKAYQAGARYVDVLWKDPQLDLIRYQHAPRDSFEEFPAWRADLNVAWRQNGDAVLSIMAQDPDLLNGQDPELVAKDGLAISRNFKPVLDLVKKSVGNWTVLGAPIPGWSAKVLPDVPPEQQESRMWDVIFEMCRIKQDDPVAGWHVHLRDLALRSSYMTAKRYVALKYTAPGTNLTIGLPDGHLWTSGGLANQNGIAFVANIPTEEIFTLPHKDKVDGFVAASKPLALPSGNVIEDFSLRFEGGCVVNATAAKGEADLHHLLDTDEGARRLGEAALVPHSSPISQSGLLFYNILYDENAANHLALGNAYRFSLQDGTTLSDEAFAAAGGNSSLIHIDFMIGSGEMDVDGVTERGTVEPVMRKGEWAFDV